MRLLERPRQRERSPERPLIRCRNFSRRENYDRDSSRWLACWGCRQRPSSRRKLAGLVGRKATLQRKERAFWSRIAGVESGLPRKRSSISIAETERPSRAWRGAFVKVRPQLNRAHHHDGEAERESEARHEWRYEGVVFKSDFWRRIHSAISAEQSVQTMSYDEIHDIFCEVVSDEEWSVAKMPQASRNISRATR